MTVLAHLKIGINHSQRLAMWQVVQMIWHVCKQNRQRLTLTHKGSLSCGPAL
jgi:hypothetical protein